MKGFGSRGLTAFMYTMWATLVVAAVVAVIERQWDTMLATILTFALTLAPLFLKHRYGVHVTRSFSVVIVLFIYASLFLGSIHNFYEKFWWWDIVLHAMSSLGLGFVAFAILMLLYKGEKVVARPGVIALFAFCFAMAIGGVWEIVEYAIDQTFGTHMQRSGLHDTMGDLIVDTIGAAIAAVVGYMYIAKKEFGFIDRMFAPSGSIKDT